MQAANVFHVALIPGDEFKALVLGEVTGLDLALRRGHRVRQEILVGPDDRVAGGDLDALGDEFHSLDRHGVGLRRRRAGYFFPSEEAIILACSRWAAMAGRTF